jgi:hypothetical protein
MAEMKTYWFNDVDRVPYKANSYAQEYVPNSDYAALLERHRRLLEAAKQSMSWLSSYPGMGADAAYDKLKAALAEEVDDGEHI